MQRLLAFTQSFPSTFKIEVDHEKVSITLAAYMKDFISTEQSGHVSSLLSSDKLKRY
jgi:hypothetical protein